jgi:hypothetical protein
MARELNDILEDIDRRVREGLSAEVEGLHGTDSSNDDDDDDEEDDERLGRHVGITASIIPMLLEYRREHAPCGHYDVELHRGLQRIDAIWPRCVRCRPLMSWRGSSSLRQPRLCRVCKEAGFRLSYLGECPACHRNDGCRSIGPDHWYFCDTHRAKWCVGSNLFSGWKHMTEEEWLENGEYLADYREVKPSIWMSPAQALLDTRVGLNDPDLDF